jgi:hypothetical protein
MKTKIMKRLLNEYQGAKGLSGHENLSLFIDYADLLKTFAMAKAASIRASDKIAPDFNIFEPLGFVDKEIVHSRVLEWLFKRNGSHGQKSDFFKLFLKEHGLSKQYASYADYEVRTEVSEEESRIDIRIFKQGRFLINIENKIFSPQGEGQLIREERDAYKTAKQLKIAKKHVHCFFLTVDPDDIPPKGSIKHIVWGRSIISCLNAYLKHVKSRSVQLFIEHYIELINNKITRGYNYDNI